jgi:hypothetical protein
VANTNPIVLNAAGRTPYEIWLNSGVTYKFALYTSTNVLIGTYDNIPAIDDPTVFNNLITVTGTNSLIGSSTPPYTAYVAGMTLSFIPVATNTGAVTIDVDGLGAKNIFVGSASALTGSELVAGRIAQIEYDGTRFQLYQSSVGPDVVRTFGNQTIAGVKTFSSTIAGNAATASSASGTDFGTATGTSAVLRVNATGQYSAYLYSDQTSWGLYSDAGGNVLFFDRSSGAAIFNGKLSTASGSAPSYSARAWVNFNGTGTVAIRASGNVSSITDLGVGLYTLNFSTAMPDSNYSWQGTQTYTDATTGTLLVEGASYATQSASSLRVRVGSAGGSFDSVGVFVTVFR